MDVFGITYIIETAQQFWSELDEILLIPDDATLQQLDATLVRFIHFCATYQVQYLQTPVQLEHACSLLLRSELFSFHSERMRELLLQDAEKTTDPHAQLILYEVLLLYGRQHPSFLRSQKKWQPLLTPLIDHVSLEFDPEVEEGYTGSVSSTGWTSRALGAPIEARLRLLAVGILYEVCRVQKFTMMDLRLFEDTFIDHLFDLIEQTCHLQDESLNYSVIRLIVALNEQFMVASIQAHSPSPVPSLGHPKPTAEQNNRVLRVLMRRLNSSKTFGENMIFMLNRAGRTPEDLCMQLLVLKLLYLLFTTKGTAEYFYTNDLCVLVDVIIREILDLDEENESLRHTYLRVLHPLMTRTQLNQVPYKRGQILQCLESLLSNSFFRDIDPTTKRLVERCLSGEWCVQLRSNPEPRPSPAFNRVGSPGADSIASATKSEYIPDSPPFSGGKPPTRQRSLKTSRSVENLKSSSLSKGKNHHHSNGLDRSHNGGSTVNLISATSSAPPMPLVNRHHHRTGSRSKQPALVDLKSATPSSSSLEHLATAEASSRPSNSIGQAVDALASHPTVPFASAGSAKSGEPTQHRRTAPPVPPKRRKPPAVPVIRASSGATITTIASSVRRSSPLSSVDPVYPS